VESEEEIRRGDALSRLELPPTKTRCAPCLGVLLVGLLLLAVASGRVILVVQKVFGGAGMEHCCAIEGVPFNYLAVFVLMCGAAAAVLLALVLQVRDWRLRRDFERKYGVTIPASGGRTPRFSSSDSGPSLHGVDCGDGD
jgi:hypothetical protein